MKAVVATLVALAILAAFGAAAVVYGGLYDVSATSPHTQPVQTLLETAQRHSVKLRARDIEAPISATPSPRGAACFRDRCEQCHGGPGISPDGIGLGMEPMPGPLIDAARSWQLREVYWITRNGVKMTGMPAWQYRMTDEDIWAVAAFVMSLADMSPADYAAHRQAAAGHACSTQPAARVSLDRSADAARGRYAVKQYACRSCHLIPGVPGSDVHVGPPLGGLARRELIAGKLPNTNAQLERWIRHTHQVDPRTAMPQLGVSEDDARDIAAFLMTLH